MSVLWGDGNCAESAILRRRVGYLLCFIAGYAAAVITGG